MGHQGGAARLHVAASIWSLTIMKQKPRSSLPRRPARPLICTHSIRVYRDAPKRSSHNPAEAPIILAAQIRSTAHLHSQRKRFCSTHTPVNSERPPAFTRVSFKPHLLSQHSLLQWTDAS